jgi:hydroxyacylglutathione hydrolase
MSKDSPKVFQLALSGMLNSFFIKGDRVILVDAGNPGDGESILEYLSVDGVKPEDVSLILITHCHRDHFGGLSVLKEKTGAPVAIHKSGAELLKEGKNNVIIPSGITGHIFKTIFSLFLPKTAISGVTPDILIDEELDLNDFGVKGKVIATPGHTDDSVSVMLDSGEAIVGDLIMKDFFNSSMPAYPIFIQNMSEIKKSIKILKNSTKVYAAHGGPFIREVIMRSFIKDMR